MRSEGLTLRQVQLKAGGGDCARKANLAARGELREQRESGSVPFITRRGERLEPFDEEDDAPACAARIVQHGGEPRAERGVILNPFGESAEVEREDELVAQGRRHVARGDAPREPFDERAAPGHVLGDEERAVFLFACEHAQDAPDGGVVVVRLQLRAARLRRQVTRVERQRGEDVCLRCFFLLRLWPGDGRRGLRPD